MLPSLTLSPTTLFLTLSAPVILASLLFLEQAKDLPNLNVSVLVPPSGIFFAQLPPLLTPSIPLGLCENKASLEEAP